MKKLLLVMLVFVFFSCAVSPTRFKTTPQVDFGYSNTGNYNTSPIVVKDFEAVGIVIVKSSETIDGNGNHTGSKITNEMLLLEVQKLGAHDAINIRIDINQKEEFTFDGIRIRTIFNYTATALAIKYTTAIAIGNGVNNFQSIGNNNINLNQMRQYTETKTGTQRRTTGLSNFSVVGISGKVMQQINDGRWIEVQYGDILKNDTVIQINKDSYIIVMDGSNRIVIPDAVTDSIGNLILIYRNRYYGFF